MNTTTPTPMNSPINSTNMNLNKQASIYTITPDTYFNDGESCEVPDDLSSFAQLIATDFLLNDSHTDDSTVINVVGWNDDEYNCLEVMLNEYGINCLIRN